MSFGSMRLLAGLLLLSFLSIFCIYTSSSFAHIFSDTSGAEFKEFGKYYVAFLPVPADPQPNETAVLNLNIQENGTDVKNVFASVVIKDKESGNVISGVPSSLYEVADLFFPQNFTESGNYLVTLTENIRGDPQYSNSPIIADFEIYVGRTGRCKFGNYTKCYCNYLKL